MGVPSIFMRLETKQDQIDVEFMLSMFRRAKIDMTLLEAKEILFCLDRFQRALNDFKNPPKVSVPSGPEEVGKKVVPMKIPPSRKK